MRIKQNARVSVNVQRKREREYLLRKKKREREVQEKKQANEAFSSRERARRARTFQNSLLVCLVSHFQPVPPNVFISIFVPGLVSRIRQGGVFGERGFFHD